MEFVWSGEENRLAQAKLSEMLEKSLPTVEMEAISFRPAVIHLPVHRDGQSGLWWAGEELDGDGETPKFWNAFGLYKPNSTQKIVVEINIRSSESGLTQGFIARQPSTGELFLMHSGVVGGGKEGCTRDGLLAHLERTTVEVDRPDGRPREGLMIGSLSDEHLPDRIREFVNHVARFKDSLDD